MIMKKNLTATYKFPRVYFLGSGKIAVPVLSKLYGTERISLIGAGTQRDRLACRGRKMVSTPVGMWMEERGLHPDKPESVNKDRDFVDHLKSLSPDLIFVASFGQILGEEILNLPRSGCVNLHASLLPLYRGASPVAAVILHGDKKTGISFMRMEKGLDSGPVYRRYEYEIPVGQNASELEDALGMLGADHVVDVLCEICSGDLQSVSQDHEKATYAGKISKTDGEINWFEPAVMIERKIRAYYPWPGVFFALEHLNRISRIRITDAVFCPDCRGRPGEVLKADKSGWIIACGEGALSLMKMVPEGKKEMTGAEFVRGCPGLGGKILSKESV